MGLSSRGVEKSHYVRLVNELSENGDRKNGRRFKGELSLISVIIDFRMETIYFRDRLFLSAASTFSMMSSERTAISDPVNLLMSMVRICDRFTIDFFSARLQ